MNYAPRPAQLASRDEAIDAALHYPQELNAAKTFVACDFPAPRRRADARHRRG
jgi:hypothetical protein